MDQCPWDFSKLTGPRLQVDVLQKKTVESCLMALGQNKTENL